MSFQLLVAMLNTLPDISDTSKELVLLDNLKLQGSVGLYDGKITSKTEVQCRAVLPDINTTPFRAFAKAFLITFFSL